MKKSLKIIITGESDDAISITLSKIGDMVNFGSRNAAGSHLSTTYHFTTMAVASDGTFLPIPIASLETEGS